MKTKSLTITLILLFLAANFLSAQENKSIKDKLSKIKSEATKIVISTSEGDVTFEGEEANQLLKKFHAKTIEKKVHWISDDDVDFDIDGDNVMVFKSENGEKHIIKHKGHGNKMLMFMDEDDNHEGMKKIKVNVEDENGEKTITVTTTENGEEKVETYKGKEADEYIEKMNKKGEMIIEIESDEDGEADNIWVGKGTKNIEKKVEVKIENDVKTVTVKTKKDGEEKVETYQGKEADEYLEKMESEDKMTIEEKSIDGKKHKKIIIKEIEKEENK